MSDQLDKFLSFLNFKWRSIFPSAHFGCIRPAKLSPRLFNLFKESVYEVERNWTVEMFFNNAVISLMDIVGSFSIVLVHLETLFFFQLRLRGGERLVVKLLLVANFEKLEQAGRRDRFEVSNKIPQTGGPWVRVLSVDALFGLEHQADEEGHVGLLCLAGGGGSQRAFRLSNFTPVG
ncbi:MAG TPA: hypothetical protein VGI40_24390 [Pirellulaceae bacterium]